MCEIVKKSHLFAIINEISQILCRDNDFGLSNHRLYYAVNRV